ncbi:SDR family NAD(P)-dependent oxidoreductase, partial [Butyricicoccus sp. 1XD8-22]
MFENKVVVITGAAQGIGKEVAIQYAKSGANVVLADKNEELVQQVCENICKEGYFAAFLSTDVRKEHDIIQLMKFAVEKYGKIDIL